MAARKPAAKKAAAKKTAARKTAVKKTAARKAAVKASAKPRAGTGELPLRPLAKLPPEAEKYARLYAKYW